MNVATCWALLLVVAGGSGDAAGEVLEVAGQVWDTQAQAVAGAEVTVWELFGDGYTAPESARRLARIERTDAEGRFTCRVRAGAWHDLLVVARRDGLALGWDLVPRKSALAMRPRRAVRIVLPAPGSIGGTLTDARGRPLAGARVQAVPTRVNGSREVYEPRDWFSARTDDQGRFSLECLAADTVVRFFVTSSDRDLVTVFPCGSQRGSVAGGYRVGWDEVALRLAPRITLRGRVLDRSGGKPVAGLRLMLYTPQPADPTWCFRPDELFSEADGRFTVTGVPPGTHLLHLMPHAEGWAGRNVLVRVQDADTVVDRDVWVEPGVPLDVVVRYQATGEPAADVRVWTDNQQTEGQRDAFMQWRETDANGLARFHVLPGMLRVTAAGGPHTVEDAAGSEGTRIRVTGPEAMRVVKAVRRRRPPVRGRVLDPNGQPVAGAEVSVGLGECVVTDHEGRFIGQQSPLYPSHQVVVRDRERNLAGARFFYRAGSEMTIPLKPAVSLRGRVTDAEGRGIPGARVDVDFTTVRRGGVRDVHAQTHLRPVYTDAEGTYCIDSAPALDASASYLLQVEAAGHESTSYRLRKDDGPGTHVTVPEIRLASATASVSGVVLDGKGRPAPDLPVFASNGSMGYTLSRATRTDAQGRFVARGLVPGPVTIQVGFGQGDDAAYVYAHTEDHVIIRLGQHHEDILGPGSRVGAPLPALSGLEIGLDEGRLRRRKLLLCFVDLALRRSQSAVEFLNARRRDLREQNVEIVCVQVAPLAPERLDTWRQSREIVLPIETLPGTPVDTRTGPLRALASSPGREHSLRRSWGLRSLPWLILADERRRIVAEGFEPARVFKYLPAPRRLVAPRPARRRR